MAKTKQQLEQEILSLEKTIGLQRKQISDLARQLENSYDERHTVSRVDYDKLRDDNEYYKNQLQLIIESNEKELKRERHRHDDLIKYFEAQTAELEAFRNDSKMVRPHNERNAGRKAKIDSMAVLTAKDLRGAGKTYTEIAETMELAVGTVYKMLNS